MQRKMREQTWNEQPCDTVINWQSEIVDPRRACPIDRTQAGLTGFGRKAEVPLCAKYTQAVLPHSHLRQSPLYGGLQGTAFRYVGHQ